MRTIQVLLAEDHTLVRAGFRELIEGFPHLKIVGEARDGYEAVRLAELHQPDVVLMDIAMPKMNGVEATRQLKRLANVHVIMLSAFVSEEYLWDSLQAGALGYLLKDTSVSELEQAIVAVSQGESYLSPAVSKYVVGNVVRRGPAESDGGESEPLTPRQREVLQLIAKGHTSQEIADQLNISLKTAETHRAQIMTRLNIRDVAGLVRYAIRHRLVPLDLDS